MNIYLFKYLLLLCIYTSYKEDKIVRLWGVIYEYTETISKIILPIESHFICAILVDYILTH